jgi:hypothetical protein
MCITQAYTISDHLSIFFLLLIIDYYYCNIYQLINSELFQLCEIYIYQSNIKWWSPLHFFFVLIFTINPSSPLTTKEPSLTQTALFSLPLYLCSSLCLYFLRSFFLFQIQIRISSNSLKSQTHFSIIRILFTFISIISDLLYLMWKTFTIPKFLHFTQNFRKSESIKQYFYNSYQNLNQW